MSQVLGSHPDVFSCELKIYANMKIYHIYEYISDFSDDLLVRCYESEVMWGLKCKNFSVFGKFYQEQLKEKVIPD